MQYPGHYATAAFIFLAGCNFSGFLLALIYGKPTFSFLAGFALAAAAVLTVLTNFGDYLRGAVARAATSEAQANTRYKIALLCIGIACCISTLSGLAKIQS